MGKKRRSGNKSGKVGRGQTMVGKVMGDGTRSLKAL